MEISRPLKKPQNDKIEKSNQQKKNIDITPIKKETNKNVSSLKPTNPAEITTEPLPKEDSIKTQKEQNPQLSDKEKTEIKVIVHKGETYLDEYPPECKLIYSKEVKPHSLIVEAINNTCAVCHSEHLESDAKTLFPCKHWGCLNCVKEKMACPICEKQEYVNMPLDTGTSKFYNTQLNHIVGKQGIVNPVRQELSLSKKSILATKGVWNCNLENLKSKGITVEFLRKNGFVLSELYGPLGIKFRKDLEDLNIKASDLYDKRFIISGDFVKKMYGIDCNYIIKKSSHEPPPFYIRKSDDVKIYCTPVEYMVRNGFLLKDFVSLGWTSESFISQKVPQVVYHSIVHEAFKKGKAYSLIKSELGITNEHLKKLGLKEKFAKYETKDSYSKKGLSSNNVPSRKNVFPYPPKKKLNPKNFSEEYQNFQNFLREQRK